MAVGLQGMKGYGNTEVGTKGWALEVRYGLDVSGKMNEERLLNKMFNKIWSINEGERPFSFCVRRRMGKSVVGNK